MDKKIRTEKLSYIEICKYGEEPEYAKLSKSCRPFSVLFIKPYQASTRMAHGPALGVLTLVSILRSIFGDRVRPIFRDMKVYEEPPSKVSELIKSIAPDFLAVSALNIEASASNEIARICKTISPSTITIVGGPYTLRQAEKIFRESKFDWIFEGASDHTLPSALTRHLCNLPLGDDIPGFSYRTHDGLIVQNSKNSLITDIDSIPIPAWDLHDFETHRKRDRPRIITNLDERPYAYLFTSRGCPYLCNYCHDIFTKKFVYQSTQRVLDEIAFLNETYGIKEFHFVDDIFNLHRPRVMEIMNAIHDRWGNSLYLAFPNGLRGDILDQKVIQAMAQAGTYNATISIETVTHRLQKLVEKNLDIEKSKRAIEAFDRHRVVVHGSFMFGFPSETISEIKETLSYAIRSPLLHAHFFAVVPQPGTPIYEMAMQESEGATISMNAQESDANDYNGNISWYQLAYGYPLRRLLFWGMLRFYFHPPRIVRFVHVYRFKVFGGLTGLLRALLLERWQFALKRVAIVIRKIPTRPGSNGRDPPAPPTSL